MIGPPAEGDYQLDGAPVRVAWRYYPSERFVLLRLDACGKVINGKTPALTPEVWAQLKPEGMEPG